MVKARVTPASTIGKVSVQQNITTTIADPKYKPKVNISISDISNVDISTLQNGDTLIYDAANTKFVSKKVEFTSSETLGSNLTPSVDNVYYLGSQEKRWHSIFVGPGSVDIDGIVLSNTSNGLVINVPGETPVTFNQVVDNADQAYTLSQGTVSAVSTLANVVTTVSEVANIAVDVANIAFGFANTVQGNELKLGEPGQGELTSEAITILPTTSITDSISLINQLVNRLLPPNPPTFPGNNSLTLQGLSSYRIANFVQTDNTSSSRIVPGGTLIQNVSRSATYTTNILNDVGPGNQGILTVYINGLGVGDTGFGAISSANGTYRDLIITDHKDYSLITGDAGGFWKSFDAQATGNVNPGWNEMYFYHTLGNATNTIDWYYDEGSPGTPSFSSLSISPSIENLTYSSTIPHYSNTSTFNLSANVSRLSGDTFPTTNTFFTGISGGSFSSPASNNYIDVGISFPLDRNLYVAEGSVKVNTTCNIASGFGSSSVGPSVSVDNSYNIGTQSFTSALANTVLRKTGTSSSMEETSITFGSTVGIGNGLASRIINPGSADTPSFSANANTFNSQSSTLQVYDATIVGAVLKHDQTNYSTGYLPVGPNLSSGRSSAQYFTFKFVRTSVSKFDIKFTGSLAGLWVALPGSSIDTTSSLNGWLNMSLPYAGSGIPGANSPGNGSNGCALGGVVTLNSSVTNHRKTCTFGTVSSSSTSSNEIYVRIKLTSGQSITALSLETASN